MLFFLPEENYMHPDAEHHADDAVSHQAEFPFPSPLLLLWRDLLSIRLSKLLPVTHTLLSIRADGKVVEEGS